MYVKTTKTIITDDDKEFCIDSDISFQIYNKKKNHLDTVICRIIEISESSDCDSEEEYGFIVADRIEINRKNKKAPKVFYFKDMQNVNYVYYD